MDFFLKRYFVLGALFFFVSCPQGEFLAAEQPGNEFLDMDITQLMNVTITSLSKKEQRLADAAAAVYVISQEDIRRSGVTHIAEALAMAPGLQVAQISASKWAVSSRGFAGYTSNKLLVLIDGRSVYSPAYSGTFWDMQNTLLEDIDRIEVIRGPGGTLWGANAVNGVINIITKKSSETLGGLVRVGMGNQESVQTGVRYGGELNDSVAGRFYLTYNDRDSNTLTETSFIGSDDAGDSWQSFQSGFRFDGQLGARAEWTLQGDVYENQGDQILFPYWIDSAPYLTENHSEVDTVGANILGRYRREFTDTKVLTLQAYYDYNNREEDYYQPTFQTIDFEAQYEIEIGDRNNITVGGGYRWIEGEFEDSFQIEAADSTDDLFSAFVQDEIKLIDDNLWLTLGVKWEHNDYTGSEWQPSARVLFKPRQNHSLWASVGRAVRTPSIIEQTGSVIVASYPTPFPGVTGTTYLRGNENFDSEEVLTYEAGYRWHKSSELNFDMSVFYNDYESIYAVHPMGRDFIFVNSVYGESYGLEFVADWKPTSWLSFVFTYSYLNMDFTEEESGLEPVRSENFIAKASPKHQASIRSSVVFAENWQTNFWLRYTDEIIARDSTALLTEELNVDDYFLFDANLIWKPTKNIEVMLAVQNLFNESELQYISELITPATEIERSVYAKLTFRF